MMTNSRRRNNIQQPSQMNLRNGYNDSDSDAESDEEESSRIDSTNRELANRAIRDVIIAQEESYPGSAEKSIVRNRYTAKNNLSGQKSSSDHIKLTKLKKQINEQKRNNEKLTELNAKKLKEKKELQERLSKLKEDVDNLMHGTTEPDDPTNEKNSDPAIDIIEQKGRPHPTMEQNSMQLKRSQIFGTNKEENKQTLNNLLKATEKSKVETDYVKRVSDRQIGSAISWYREPSLEATDEKISTQKENILESYGSSISQSKAMMSSAEDFFGPRKPFIKPINSMIKSIDINDTDNATIVENADFFNNVLPANMTAYNSDYFNDPNIGTNLNSKLPEISNPNKNIHKNYFQGQFFNSKSNQNYLSITNSEEPGINMPQNSIKKRQITPRNLKNLKNGSKTARGHTPSMLPSLHTPRDRSNNRNKDLELSGIRYVKQHLDTTNKTNLEKAYK